MPTIKNYMLPLKHRKCVGSASISSRRALPWWAMTSTWMAQHCHPHERTHLALLKVKNLCHIPLESLLRPRPLSNPLSNPSRAGTAKACSTATALSAAKTWRRAAPCRSAFACRPVSPPSLTTCHELRGPRRLLWRGVPTAFPAAILSHCTLAPLASYRVSPPSRSWPLVTSCFKCF